MQSKKIREGDYILLYLDRRRTYLVKVEDKRSFHTHKGFIQLGDLVGREYGSLIQTNLGIEFALMRPLIHDYMVKSARRTQITYPKDAALIVMFSGISSGSRIVEAGTGAGALTAALAHFVRPDGRIYSYEDREEFLEIAKKNIVRAGLIELVEFRNSDIAEGIREDEIDSVILDLATPWLIVPHAYDALKPSGTLVSFSPTIDQVVKTAEALRENNFRGIESFECLLRKMQAERGKTRPQTLMIGHTGYITFARKTKL